MGDCTEMELDGIQALKSTFDSVRVPIAFLNDQLEICYANPKAEPICRTMNAQNLKMKLLSDKAMEDLKRHLDIYGVYNLTIKDGASPQSVLLAKTIVCGQTFYRLQIYQYEPDGKSSARPNAAANRDNALDHAIPEPAASMIRQSLFMEKYLRPTEDARRQMEIIQKNLLQLVGCTSRLADMADAMLRQGQDQKKQIVPVRQLYKVIQKHILNSPEPPDGVDGAVIADPETFGKIISALLNYLLYAQIDTSSSASLYSRDEWLVIEMSNSGVELPTQDEQTGLLDSLAFLQARWLCELCGYKLETVYDHEEKRIVIRLYLPEFVAEDGATYCDSGTDLDFYRKLAEGTQDERLRELVYRNLFLDECD